MKTGKSRVYSPKQLEKINKSIPVVMCPTIHKLAGVFLPGQVEATPIVFRDRLLTVTFCREGSRGTRVLIHDFFTRELVKAFPWDYGLGCAIVAGGSIRIFGSTDWERKGNAIYTATLDTGLDIDPGTTKLAFRARPDQQVYNTSVCTGSTPGEYIMAYELREPDTVPFSIRFLKSTDLVAWEPIGTIFQPGIYAACPTIRYSNVWYYIIYLEHRKGYVECISRTKDFTSFDHFSGNAEWGPDVQVLSPRGYIHEGLNNSDIDLVEYKGMTYFVYADGDQRGWDDMRTAVYLGPIDGFFMQFWRD